MSELFCNTWGLPMRTFYASAAFVLTVLFLPGCDKDEALQLNDNIVKASGRLDATFRAFARAVQPAIEEKSVKMDEVRRAYKNCQDTVESIKTEATTWKVPAGEGAKKLMDCHNDLMAVEEDVIKDYGEIIKILEDKNLSKSRKADKIVGLDDDQKRRNVTAFGNLQDAQRELVRAHGFKLEPLKK